jgi:hypothetical protein
LVVKVTVPVGVVAVTPELSLTVAMQSLAWPITTGVKHVIVAVVGILSVPTIEIVSELPVCVPSPL